MHKKPFNSCEQYVGGASAIMHAIKSWESAPLYLVRGGSRIFTGEGLQVLGAPFWPRGAVLRGSRLGRKRTFSL